MNNRIGTALSPNEPLGLRRRGLIPNAYDLIVFLIVAGAFIALAHAAREMNAPLAKLDAAPIVLDPHNLPEYALRTTLRMVAAIFASLLFTFIVAPLAAKSRKAERVIIPALDILQSVPVLGFLTFTVVFFLKLFPGSEMGAECASIFAIFTAQAWNMTFSFYQSLRTVPNDLDEASRHFRLSPWLRFWRLEVPFAAPGLIWNTMMSMSGGWFFVVASEAITVGSTTLKLPGIGSWLALAIERKTISAVIWAVAAMGVVILAYDQFIFRPIVAWADKFRFEQTAAQHKPRSWVYDFLRRTQLIRRGLAFFTRLMLGLSRFRFAKKRPRTVSAAWPYQKWGDRLWSGMVAAGAAYSLWLALHYVRSTVDLADIYTAIGLGCITLLRVVVLIFIASVIWVPAGVWIGLRPHLAERVQPIAQFLAAFPANVLFPMVVAGIVAFHLNPDIWLSPLIILGTQWYILFNVIAGASAFPSDLREVSALYRLRSWLWWRKVILPGIFPYYVTGALTASGGSWNASIVAEVASWGATTLHAHGLGAFIARATDAGDYPRVVLGIAVMSVFVILFNRLLWRPLYAYAQNRLRLD